MMSTRLGARRALSGLAFTRAPVAALPFVQRRPFRAKEDATTNTNKVIAMAVVLFLMVVWLTVPAGRAEAKGHVCSTGGINATNEARHQDGADLIITGPRDCLVGAGTFKLGNVHILEGGTLRFADANIDFWAKNILVEKGGSLLAGVFKNDKGEETITPIANGVVTIHLYGADQTCLGDAECKSPKAGLGVKCQTDAQCGVPNEIWNSGTLPGGDQFYMYHPLPRDDGDPLGYFGYKVLAVSYGGTLRLFGKKGATYGATECGEAAPTTSGTSWARLGATAKKGTSSLTVDRKLSLKDGDQIVVTTTDYLPGHSEQLTVVGDVNCGTTIAVKEALQYDHVGVRYSLADVPEKVLSPELRSAGAETRAAVGLLGKRNIRIVSAGDTMKDDFPAESTGYFFGGHVIARQGFTTFQVQGVEFSQLGQGGRLGHYPIHFHHARKTPPDTFVKDSSIHDSMTRWIVLHGTQNVTLERNVGYKSIGHGFYLEDGTEINNTLRANLGVYARAAVQKNDGTAQRDNPRKVPGILAAPDKHDSVVDALPYKSDYDHPTVFWIMNGWNDFQDNMAAGAGTCGACYWLVPGYNSGMSRSEQWDSYASMQSNQDRAGMTPLKSFVGNFCSSAMMAFQTVGGTFDCNGIQPGPKGDFPTLSPIKNPLAPVSTDDTYYPSVANGSRFATQCSGGDCSNSPPKCGDAGDGTSRPDCMVTVLDRFTTSFNWAQFTVAAIWLRPQWYLVTDSVITDVQQAGITMVTGGGYAASDVVPGHWALLRKSALIGHTQADNPFAFDGGPFNPSGLQCATNAAGNRDASYCLSIDEGVSHQTTNFGMYQRLFSVYDGPAFQDSNAYLNIKTRTIDDCSPVVTDELGGKKGRCDKPSAWVAGAVQGLPKADDGKTCYMPNAAIGWKQPNGFYYPPAFHSTNLFFKDVDVRHFVVTPLFQEGTFDIDSNRVEKEYCVFDSTLFNGFSAIDRQTVLNDDDGTLTGYKKTTVINLDEFFAAPVDAVECRSDNTSRTSPYDYVTTVVYPGCATPRDQCDPDAWVKDCTTSQCTGIPLFRQDLLPRADANVPRSIRMMGQSTYQRSTLTANHGTYYLDTASKLAFSNRFKEKETYYLFLVFAKLDTEQTYQFFGGENFDLGSIKMVQANIDRNPIVFDDKNAQPLPSERVKRLAKGVVEVTLKVADFPDVAKKYQDARQKKCQPATYCTWNADANNKAGACEDKTPRDPAVKDAVCRWANADLHCPDGGCIGIVFTMPDGFNKPPVDPDSVRPAAACLPKAAPWDVSLQDRAVPDDPDPNKAVCPNPKENPVLQDFCK